MLSIVVQTATRANIIHVSDSSMTLRNKIQYWSFVKWFVAEATVQHFRAPASFPEFKSQRMTPKCFFLIENSELNGERWTTDLKQRMYNMGVVNLL